MKSRLSSFPPVLQEPPTGAQQNSRSGMDSPSFSQALVLFQHLNYSGTSRMLSDPPSLCWKSFPSDTVTICFYLYFPLHSQSSGPAFASAEPPPSPCSSVTQCSNMFTRDRRLIKVRITVCERGFQHLNVCKL